MIMGPFGAHVGIILGSCWDGSKTKCWSLVDFVFTFSRHVWDMFGHTLLEHTFGRREEIPSRMRNRFALGGPKNI